MRAVLITAILFFAYTFVGCDSNSSATDEGEISDIRMLPDSVSMQIGDTTHFSVTPLTASGDPVPTADVDLRWWSTDTTVFTVDEEGMAIAKGTGSAYCMAELPDAVSKAGFRFVGRDSAWVTVLF